MDRLLFNVLLFHCAPGLLRNVKYSNTFQSPGPDSQLDHSMVARQSSTLASRPQLQVAITKMSGLSTLRKGVENRDHAGFVTYAISLINEPGRRAEPARKAMKFRDGLNAVEWPLGRFSRFAVCWTFSESRALRFPSSGSQPSEVRTRQWSGHEQSIVSRDRYGTHFRQLPRHLYARRLPADGASRHRVRPSLGQRTSNPHLLRRKAQHPLLPLSINREPA